MSPERVRELCVENLTKGPDITSAEGWDDSSRPCGLLIGFSSGARLWVAITTAASATSAAPARAATAASAPLPQLFDRNGRITAQRAESYLAAVLMDARTPHIAAAYAYSVSAAKHPGIGLHLADGGRAFLPFVYAAAAGSAPARRPFSLAYAF
ncbi:hypothetical protein [Streptomyces sp. NPDC055912]|uniref:hypothetical protein n=1 Tax=Streptomyces sp. NPDC055912 TaxID=3345660 RepID=UPI0035DDA878